jgi:hypothetical protein
LLPVGKGADIGVNPGIGLVRHDGVQCGSSERFETDRPSWAGVTRSGGSRQ